MKFRQGSWTGAAACLCAALLAFCSGYRLHNANDRLECRQVDIVDENGRIRISLGVKNSRARVTLFDGDGCAAVDISGDDRESVIKLIKSSDSPPPVIIGYEKERRAGYLAVAGESGAHSINVSASPDRALLHIVNGDQLWTVPEDQE